MDQETLISASSQELDRVIIIGRVISRELKQVEAAKLLGVSTRQIKRLVKAFKDKKIFWPLWIFSRT